MGIDCQCCCLNEFNKPYPRLEKAQWMAEIDETFPLLSNRLALRNIFGKTKTE